LPGFKFVYVLPDDEFIVLSNRDSNPMKQNPENLDPEVEGDILLHTPSGRLINWAEDHEGNLRFFIQPFEEDGEVRPENVIPLPLGFDEFMGIVDEEGNVLDESRRGLPLEERKKLEEEDKKKAKKAAFQARIEEMKKSSAEKIKELGTDLYIKELEWKLEDCLIEESFKAELDAVDEEDQDVPVELEETSPKSEAEKLEDEQLQKARKEAEEEKDGNEDAPRDGGDGGDGKDNGEEDDDDDDEEDDDEDDKKPRSFGTVAMVAPDQLRNNCRSEAGSNIPSFPTIFASLSLVRQVGKCFSFLRLSC
jgi:hypothetical protein